MKKLDFNQVWTVQKDGSDVIRTVHLPEDAMLYEKRSKDSPTAGASGYFEPGRYLYKKNFNAPEEWKGQKVILECEAVYQNSSVLLNGKELASRPYGYTDFYVDLTEDLLFEQENELLVIADNAKAPNSRWYSGSGIFRPVWIHVGEKNAIAPQGIRVLPKDLETAEVTVKLLEEDPSVTVKVEVLDGETVVVSGEGSPVTLSIPEAKSWSADAPNLYRCRAAVYRGEEMLDCDEVSFGLRTLSWDGTGLKVNGEETLLRGACIHHDNGILGAACFADAEERRVRILKEAGFNAIRSAHNPLSKSMLDACDRLGMYVMDENFDMWIIHKNPFDYGKDNFLKWWQEDTKAMVDKDYSHPSVILYSLGNEISDLGMAEGQKVCKEMAEFVRGLDSSRPTTMGINLMLASMVAKGKGMYGNGKEGEKESSVGAASIDSAPTSTFFNILMNKMGTLMDLAAKGKGPDKIVEAVSGNLDMPGYNYATSRYQKEAKMYPDRPFVGSETLPKSLYNNWQLVKALPQLTGDFMWTGWDYLGEAAIGTIRYKDKKTKEDTEDGLIISGGAGIIDICGKQRPEVHWGRIIWGLQKEPGIGVEPYTHVDDFRVASMWRDTDAVESWSWAGCEGKASDVVVYTDAPAAELFVNDKSYGKKKVKEDKAFFKKVIYEPGTLKAVVYDGNGDKVGESRLTTAKGATFLNIEAEKPVLKANGQDLCFLDISLVGMDGVVKSSEDKKLTIKVEGAGTLQGFGSSRPHMAETFVGTEHTTYYGKALAAVRAGLEKGDITVTVSADNVASKTITIKVE